VRDPFLFIVGDQVPAKTLAEFVALGQIATGQAELFDVRAPPASRIS